MTTQTVSPETLAENRAFSQRRFDRAMKKADFLEKCSIEAENNDIFDIATQLQNQADKLRKSVMKAARDISSRHNRILREFQPKLEG